MNAKQAEVCIERAIATLEEQGMFLAEIGTTSVRNPSCRGHFTRSKAGEGWHTQSWSTRGVKPVLMHEDVSVQDRYAHLQAPVPMGLPANESLFNVAL